MGGTHSDTQRSHILSTMTGELRGTVCVASHGYQETTVTARHGASPPKGRGGAAENQHFVHHTHVSVSALKKTHKNKTIIVKGAVCVTIRTRKYIMP